MKILKLLRATVTLVLLLFVSTSYSQTGNTAKIGKQEWMAENLNVSTFRNGDPIPELKAREEWKEAGEKGRPAWCYYENDPANGKEYGKLYNWHAVNDARGLAPKGWHVPTDDEWWTLVEYLGGHVAGSKMKEPGTSHWKSPNRGATNESASGFSALPGGYRYSNGGYDDMGYFAYFWSSSPKSDNNGAWYRVLGFDSSGAGRTYTAKSYGISVRCVRD